tara:strand:+ start:246 stop:884 length:639 start_codon:yes stop_codon:yes gene_type:complete
MKHLREYIRQVLLTEAAKGPSDLPDNVFVQMRDRGELAEFEFVKKTGESEKYGPRYDRTVEQKDGIYGSIQLYSVEEYEVGPCSNAFMISWSGATSGYGPMLYDLAMEWATANGGGLIADRSTVSDEARAVWDYYLNNRSDIEIVQLDDPNNELTDVEEDNCDQEIAGGQNYLYPKPPERVDPDWPKSALSKMYRKTNDSMTQELKALGKLV